MKNRFMIVDVETTGNKPGTDKIIQIGAILIEDGEIIEQISSFVNPNMKLSPFIKQFTGIEDDMLKRAPAFELIAPMLLEMLEGSYFVAHNVPFDMTFLKAEFESCGYEFHNCPTIDTVELSRLLFPSLGSYKLSQLASEFDIDHDQPHRADSDAEATAHLLVKLLTKLQNLPYITLQKLGAFAPKFQSSLKILLEQIIEEKTGTLPIEEQYDIYRNIALKHRKVRTIINDENISIDQLQIKPMMKNIQRVTSKFELREGQMEMMETIKEAFENHTHSLIEAGTGTGKTLGYLVPALLFAKLTDKRVVVSTFTTHLQEQIMLQEIAMLKKAATFPFQATIFKGRHHYLCLRKFEESLESIASDTYDVLFTKAQILVWLTETNDGDVDELNLTSGGKIFWNKIKSESNCCNKDCQWFSRCFYLQKRKEAYASDLIITNHALLLADIKSGFALLPDYSELIIDEAHHLDDVASENFGIKLDNFSIQMALNQIGLPDGSELLQKAASFADEAVPQLSSKINMVAEHYVDAKNAIDELFRSIRSFAISKNAVSKNEIGRTTYRFHSAKEEGPLWKEVKNKTFIAIEKLEDIKDGIMLLLNELEIIKEQNGNTQSGLMSGLKSVVQSLEDIANGLCKLLYEHESNNVTWIEVEPRGAQNSAFLYGQPIDTSEILADRLFAKKQSVILTSATLAIGDSFNYIKDSLGLSDFEVMTKKITSPFSYKNQVKLMIPTDIPEVKDVEQTLFIEEISVKIIETARVTKGRMLILFTSYDMLEKTFYNVKAASELDGFVLIGQGISSGSRAKLTKNFKQHEQAILFGTSSFWEGIDIPGEDLSCIVIVRLPFSPPDNAMMAAKANALKDEGKNAFMELFLPQAILRFKQGFGRLIRAKNDRGAVIVLDRRIVTKSYGKQFIAALPDIDILEGKTDVLLRKLSDWL